MVEKGCAQQSKGYVAMPLSVAFEYREIILASKCSA